jgi:hypothetical protein
LADEQKSPETNWKEQAQREKERLARELDDRGGAGESGEVHEMPPPDFMSFVTGLATQALIAMGAVPDPFTGKVEARLEVAKYHIDLIAILEEKTRGNLSPEECSSLRGALSDLRMRYVAAADGGATAGDDSGPGGDRSGNGPGPNRPGKIILPT